MTYPFGNPIMVAPFGITHVGATYLSGVGIGPVNISLPAGSVAGDLAVAITGFDTSTPSGFTAIRQSVMANNGGQYYRSSYKRLTPTDIANGYVTIADNGTANVLLVYRGAISAAHAGQTEPAAGASTANVTYAKNAGSIATIAWVVDRDGINASAAVSNATKIGANAASGNYGVMVGHNLSPIANGTVIGWSGLTASQGQIACIIDLIY
jgi:hypothetical protein